MSIAKTYNGVSARRVSTDRRTNAVTTVPNTANVKIEPRFEKKMRYRVSTAISPRQIRTFFSE